MRRHFLCRDSVRLWRYPQPWYSTIHRNVDVEPFRLKMTHSHCFVQWESFPLVSSFSSFFGVGFAQLAKLEQITAVAINSGSIVLVRRPAGRTRVPYSTWDLLVLPVNGTSPRQPGQQGIATLLLLW